MTPSPVNVFDVSRLVSRRDRDTPTGIDRVELSTIESALQTEGELAFYATRGHHSWFLPRDQVASLVSALRIRWSEGSESGHQSARKLLDWLGAEQLDFGRPASISTPMIDGPRGLSNILKTREWQRLLRRPDFRVTYKNVSHHHLDKEGFLSGLKKAWDARIEIYWHDGIPIRFPEYSKPGDAEKHRLRLRATLQNADLIEVNSAWTEEELRVLAAQEDLAVPTISVAPLRSELPPSPPPLVGARPYFVSVGTIEPRKNHKLLLEVWRELSEDMGERTPALVLAGRRGWMSTDTFALIDRSPALQSHVFEAPDLPDSALSSLIGSAQALLMPSFAEGFGLPVAEAGALGTPIIATNLHVYKELNVDRMHLLSPIDGTNWMGLIKGLVS